WTVAETEGDDAPIGTAVGDEVVAAGEAVTAEEAGTDEEADIDEEPDSGVDLPFLRAADVGDAESVAGDGEVDSVDVESGEIPAEEEEGGRVPALPFLVASNEDVPIPELFDDEEEDEQAVGVATASPYRSGDTVDEIRNRRLEVEEAARQGDR